MFGYITVNPGGLEEEQLLRYRSYYCGVCRSLTKRYGRAGQLTLSNDMTFTALLLTSLYEPAAEEHDFRCGLHPVKGRHFITSAAVDYAADMNLLLAWYKCEDDMQDDPGLKSRAGTALLRKGYEKVKAAWPEKDERLGALIRENARL